MIFLVVLLLVLGTYALVLLGSAWAWARLPVPKNQSVGSKVFFTVIIPVKDEQGNLLPLLQDLERQTYPSSLFEVLVVDDHSIDGTPDLVNDFLQRSSLQVKLLFLASFPEKRLKKGAIELGVSQAQGDWIVCTDGDCRVHPNWLTVLNACRLEQKAKLISGPVMLTYQEDWFQQLQALEFSALIGVGAACIGWQQPTMCNGANLAYEKAAFLGVNGFAGNDHLPSGDDEFLMHKIHQKYPGSVAFLKDQEAIVKTSAIPAFKSFLEQRKRWASKWKHYTRTAPKALAVLVLTANVALWVVLGLAVAGTLGWWWFWWALAMKLVPDLVLLAPVLDFFRRKRLLLFIGLLQVLYVPYVLATAILGWRGTYAWKNRQHLPV
ncbi:glycosyltransferase [Nibribacter ruber]|uniref:Glycosyltransferase n=1 Tax=Nibribacter ruber TaxID=2698458 RepID=A0A6P1NWP7_9BACT|nr:glycosyltransferase [Nibribacter ruber]QHL86649.1 glycosyltransferase [Nibribacter ruber]